MATNTATVKMIRNIIDGTTPIQSRALLNAAFPVGTILYRTDAVSPASIYGGSWERIVDVGGGHSLGEEGGEAEHTITVDEMPSHEHAGRIVGDMSSKNDAIAMNTSWSKYQTIGDFTNDIRDRNNAATKPHNNMPPYLAVTAWKRIE